MPKKIREDYTSGDKRIDKIGKTRVDGCLANLIWYLNNHGCETLGCCCGHGKYNISIVYKSPNGKIWDLISGIEIKRKKRFYLKDKQGYYYIPEVVNG